jgi:uncharacterized membrane protein YvlD (DUF360 family)
MILHRIFFTSTLSVMLQDKTEKRANTILKIAFRVFINVGIVWWLDRSFGDFFALDGGYQGIALVGLTFTALNMIVVPILNVISLPIKFFAWIIAFILVNAGAVWLTLWFIATLNVPGVSLAIEGGIIGWILVSVLFGVGNWLVRAVVK